VRNTVGESGTEGGRGEEVGERVANFGGVGKRVQNIKRFKNGGKKKRVASNFWQGGGIGWKFKTAGRVGERETRLMSQIAWGKELRSPKQKQVGRKATENQQKKKIMNLGPRKGKRVKKSRRERKKQRANTISNSKKKREQMPSSGLWMAQEGNKKKKNQCYWAEKYSSTGGEESGGKKLTNMLLRQQLMAVVRKDGILNRRGKENGTTWKREHAKNQGE